MCTSYAVNGSRGTSTRDLAAFNLDFGGSVQSSRGHIEGTAIKFNKAKKGARSYYSLFCTVVKTKQFFALHHRPGNGNDFNGAKAFTLGCLLDAKTMLSPAVLELCIDSILFSQDILTVFQNNKLIFTTSVPFERLLQLNQMVERRQR